MKYLYALNPRVNETSPWLPEVDSHTSGDHNIIVAHDWFSQGSYSRGAFYLGKNNKIEELQSHPYSKVCNAQEFIFEEGSSDHKGLIAITFGDNKDTPPYFIMDALMYDYQVNLYFEKGTDWDYIQRVYLAVEKNYEDHIISLTFDKLSLTYNEYLDMIKELSDRDLTLI